MLSLYLPTVRGINCNFVDKFFSLKLFIFQDGRLVIWNNASEIHQQYSPSSHLSTQITCLAWSPASASNTDKKNKKNENKGASSSSDLIALGTSAGSLLVYSVKQGDIVTTFDVSNHKAGVCKSFYNFICSNKSTKKNL